jgi:uncharacterized protein (DUF362 family)/NAD-dependent dihydropyrimidine dehydrogenase PreA subunit
MGGWQKFVRPGEQLIIKPNLLMKKRPEEAVTTHPAVVEAAARGIIAAGGHAIVADSPGGPFNKQVLQWVYRGCGMTGAAQRSGAALNYNTGEADLKVTGGRLLTSVRVMEAVAMADGIISISKLKTHGMTRLTGAVKNLFGIIPGLKKAEYHVRMPGVKEFSAMLLDVALAAAPRLHLMDAVEGMQGEGPSAGDKVHIGLLLAGTCPFALDHVAAALAGVDAREVPTIVVAIKRGYIDEDVRSINIIGDQVAFPRIRFRMPPRIRDFDLLKANVRLPGWLLKAINKSLRPSPVFSPEICLGCGECSRLCPAGAITVDSKPHANMEQCIRCFCCQELCPQKAVTIRRPWLGRVLFK